MNAFDKLCAVLAFLIGTLFVLLGVLGLFIGSSAHFTLPPVLGGLPALVGWGIVRSIYIAWNASLVESKGLRAEATREVFGPDISTDRPDY